MQVKKQKCKKPAYTPGYVNANQLPVCGFETPFARALL